MPKPRTDLQMLLENALGSRHVYFQPPETVKMSYPAIVYGLAKMDGIHADNLTYVGLKAYQVTVIDKDPDSALPDRISELPYCRFDRYFTADKLNHYVFTLYF